MKIYLTGVTGFIGSHLSAALFEEHTVRCHNRGTPIIAGVYYFRPDLIINCAAEIYDHTKMFDSNVKLVYDILEYIKVNPYTRLIQLGSSSEYGPTKRATSEKTLLKPIDEYQSTKGAATLMCIGAAKQHHLDISIVRPYSVFGPDEKPHRLFPMLYKACVKNEPMNLYAGEHDFIYIDDFIDNLVNLVNTDKKYHGEIFNFGSGKMTSNKRVLDLFKFYTENYFPPVEYVEEFQKKFESNVWVADIKKSFKKLDFKLNYTLEQGISDFIRKANY